jgi:DNA-binding transcriptional regulator YiaG
MIKNDKYRVTQVSKKGDRHSIWMTEKQLFNFRIKRLKILRKQELRLTQKALATAVGANLRTFQDWEMGRSAMPKPVEILIELMRDMPSVRKRLLIPTDMQYHRNVKRRAA